MNPVYCAIIGNEGVGKTSALLAYASNDYLEDPLPSTFDDYSCNVMVGGLPYQLTLHDTAEDNALCDQRVDVFLLIFAVDNKKSFDDIKFKWKPWLMKNYPNKPFVVAANKVEKRGYEDDGLISTEEGKRIADLVGAFSYEEFSVKTQEGLRDTFEKVILAFIKKPTQTAHPKKKKPKRNSCIIC